MNLQQRSTSQFGTIDLRDGWGKVILRLLSFAQQRAMQKCFVLLRHVSNICRTSLDQF